MGGGDEPGNIVKLTPEEHFTAHLLLMKINPKHVGLIASVIKMTGPTANRRNKLYGWVKRRHSDAISKKVFCYSTETGQLVATYSNVGAASIAVGLHHQTIYSCIRIPGRRTAGGFSWSYSDVSPGPIKLTPTGRRAWGTLKNYAPRHAWNGSRAIVDDWKRATELEQWLKSGTGSLATFIRQRSFTSNQTCYRIVQHIKKGWSPTTDKDFQEWKTTL